MEKNRQRSVYVTQVQKKKLIELMSKHPELVSCKITEGFNYKGYEQLWRNIAKECNTIPGAKKTWRQWRKSWQDIRWNAKKQELANGKKPFSVTMLSTNEHEAIGLKNDTNSTENTPHKEFVLLEESNVQSFSNDIESTASLSGPDSSEEEEKVFTRSKQQSKNNNKTPSKHSNSCVFNCDLMAAQEQRKLQIKGDYYTFKKGYLQQKLILIREQTEALKSIARELAK